MGGNSQKWNTWWKVDLSGVYNIYSISIMFKNYIGDGMLFIYIQF